MNKKAMDQLETKLRNLYLSAGRNVSKFVNQAIKESLDKDSLEAVLVSLKKKIIL